MNEMTPPPHRPNQVRSTASLLSEVLNHLSGLVRKEIALAKAEIRDRFHTATVAIGLLVGAVVLAMVALNVLAGAAVAGLAQLTEIGAGWSALIVGGIIGLVAFLLARKGANDLKPSNLAPRKTARSIERHAQAIKESRK